MIERDVQLPDGRTLHVYDTGQDGDNRNAVVWHHGTPGLGWPPEPLFPAAERLGVRWIGVDRPGYGGSTVNAGRTIASVARDVGHMADALGIDRFAVMGMSGGGSFALGCAAVLGDRVRACATLAAVAPFDTAEFDWFAGMSPSGVAALGTAAAGRPVRAALDASGFDYVLTFTDDDLALFDGPWGWLGSVAGGARDAGPWGEIDDDVCYTHAWECDPADIQCPALVFHGTDDTVVPARHGIWLAERCPTASLRLIDGASHFTIMHQAEHALEWLQG
ncbi:MAG: alpha/beta hydrolase [Thermomicrobiales bacterium]